jgi:hypothetical protein
MGSYRLAKLRCRSQRGVGTKLGTVERRLRFRFVRFEIAQQPVERQSLRVVILPALDVVIC